jgi:hypothetical protein
MNSMYDNVDRAWFLEKRTSIIRKKEHFALIGDESASFNSMMLSAVKKYLQMFRLPLNWVLSPASTDNEEEEGGFSLIEHYATPLKKRLERLERSNTPRGSDPVLPVQKQWKYDYDLLSGSTGTLGLNID